MEALPTMNVEKPVFIDETWTSTNMTRSCGRATRGKRCLGSAPCGHWQTTTFVGALRHRKISAPRVIEGPMDGDVFLEYVRSVLCPTLTPGDEVILDNLCSHKVDRGRRSHPGHRRNGPLPAAILPRPEPYRKALLQTQSPASQSRQTKRRYSLAGNRRAAQLHLPRRMHELLPVLRIYQHLNRKGSSPSVPWSLR